jgi:hypothetical protein
VDLLNFEGQPKHFNDLQILFPASADTQVSQLRAYLAKYLRGANVHEVFASKSGLDLEGI